MFLPRWWDTFNPNTPDGLKRLVDMVVRQARSHWRSRNLSQAHLDLYRNSRDVWFQIEGRRRELLGEPPPTKSEFSDLMVR